MSMSVGGNEGGVMAEINVTPLVDVMLVLLVIFIITAPLMASTIKLDLPKTDAAKPSDPPKFITLVVDQAGQIYFNDKPVNEYFLTQKASANLNLREVPGVLKAENYGFAIRKGDDKLRARLDKVLDEIRADGTYDKIYAKWFGGNK